MSRPITKGGFSNDGRKIMESKASLVSTFAIDLHLDGQMARKYDIDADINTSNEITISKTLYASQLSLSEFYNIPQIVSFIEHHLQKHNQSTPFIIAIQCPDELLTDLIYFKKILHHYNFIYPKVSFYTLGDTSYSSCCVDFVSAKHINAHMIIHLGFACFSTEHSSLNHDHSACVSQQSSQAIAAKQLDQYNQQQQIPVVYAFGNISLSSTTLQSPALNVETIQHNVTNSSSNLQELVTSSSLPLLSLLMQLLSSKLTSFWREDGSNEEIDFSPSYDDYDEYPDELLDTTDEQYSVLVLLDQRFIHHLPLLQHILLQCDFNLSLPPFEHLLNNCKQTISSMSDEQQSVVKNITQYIQNYFLSDNLSSTNNIYNNRRNINLVLAYPQSQLRILSDIQNSLKENTNVDELSQKIIDQNIPLNTLSFAGYVFPIFSQKFSSEVLQTLTQRQIWHRFFNKTQWNIVLLTKHNIVSPVESPSLESYFSQFSIPDPSSSSILTHWAMNFTQHMIYDCFPLTADILIHLSTSDTFLKLLPHISDQNWVKQILLAYHPQIDTQTQQQSEPLTIDYFDEPFTMHLFAPSAGQSRVLSQRFYLVEKAKNTSTIGIVAGTSSSPYILHVIERLKKLFTQNDIKYYVIAIGKINEAKLLNFGDISMFVVITCPMSVLFQFYNKQGRLQTNFGQQQQAYALANQSSTSASVASMIDMITPFECELAFNTMEFSWNGQYTTHFRDVVANQGRLGITKEMITEDDLETIKIPSVPTTTTDNDADSSNNNNIVTKNENIKNDVTKQTKRINQEEETGVRYSTIDNKYHEVTTKKLSSSTTTGDSNPSETSNSLIEQQTFGLIDAETNKQLIYVRNLSTGQVTVKERSFQGLAHDQSLSAENMIIQPGFHGTSEGYVRFDTKDDNNSKRI